ncbi:MAG TPA: SlyX family protein [Rhodocyclaceae bacterium]
MEQRLTELEIKLSFTEDMVEELNRIVFRQQQQIDALAMELKAQRQQMQATQPGEALSLRDEIPPHY